MLPLSLHAPPTPGEPAEAMRWEETRRRRRMLDGTWRTDMETRLHEHLGLVRRAAWGPTSLALNPFRNICRELAVLYDSPPDVSHEDTAAAKIIADALHEAGAWGLMQRVQVYTIGCREFLLRADVEGDRVLLRPVPPDMVRVDPLPARPDTPGRIREWRRRKDDAGPVDWYEDEIDIRQPAAPVYRVLDSKGEDVSKRWKVDGWPDLWRRVDGSPFLPTVLYHAQRTGDRIWEPYDGIELVEASLDLAVLHAMMVHTFRDASWPQRYGVDVEVVGTNTTDTTMGSRSEIVTDPSTLLMLQRRADSEAQPLIGQWQPGGDVAVMEETLSNLVARVAQDAGVPPSDVQRLGGTARSGVAISLTNEGKRAAQRRFAETFRAADEQLVSIVASMLGRSMSVALPERGYEVMYREIPLSPDELRARREHALAMVQAGLMSRAEAYRETHPGVTLERARREVEMLATNPGGEDGGR